MLEHAEEDQGYDGGHLHPTSARGSPGRGGRHGRRGSGARRPSGGVWVPTRRGSVSPVAHTPTARKGTANKFVQTARRDFDDWEEFQNCKVEFKQWRFIEESREKARLATMLSRPPKSDRSDRGDAPATPAPAPDAAPPEPPPVEKPPTAAVRAGMAFLRGMHRQKKKPRTLRVVIGDDEAPRGGPAPQPQPTAPNGGGAGAGEPGTGGGGADRPPSPTSEDLAARYGSSSDAAVARRPRRKHKKHKGGPTGLRSHKSVRLLKGLGRSAAIKQRPLRPRSQSQEKASRPQGHSSGSREERSSEYRQDSSPSSPVSSPFLESDDSESSEDAESGSSEHEESAVPSYSQYNVPTPQASTAPFRSRVQPPGAGEHPHTPNDEPRAHTPAGKCKPGTSPRPELHFWSPQFPDRAGASARPQLVPRSEAFAMTEEAVALSNVRQRLDAHLSARAPRSEQSSVSSPRSDAYYNEVLFCLSCSASLCLSGLTPLSLAASLSCSLSPSLMHSQPHTHTHTHAQHIYARHAPPANN